MLTIFVPVRMGRRKKEVDSFLEGGSESISKIYKLSEAVRDLHQKHNGRLKKVNNKKKGSPLHPCMDRMAKGTKRKAGEIGRRMIYLFLRENTSHS